MRKLGIMILALAALTVAGCGEGGHAGSSDGTGDAGATPAEAGGTTRQVTGDPLTRLERGLEAAGYRIIPAELTGAQGGLEAEAKDGESSRRPH